MPSRPVDQMTTTPSFSKGNDFFLFFTPEAAVGPHFAAQCILARTMAEQGHRVALTRCNGVFSRCPVMDMCRLPYDADPTTRKELCAHCTASASAMLSSYGIDYLDLDKLVTPEMLCQADAILDGWQGSLADLSFEGVRFGEFSSHDVVLSLKKYNFEEIDEETRLAWRSYIRNSILAYLLTGRVCRDIPFKAIVHFNDYALLIGARMAGLKLGLPVYSVSLAPHKSVDFRNFIINRDIWRQAIYRQVKGWPRWRELAIDGGTIREIAEDLVVRMKSSFSHIYSSAKTHDGTDVLAQLGLSRQRRTIVAYTSSYDELVAGQKHVMSMGYPEPEVTVTFPTQIGWVNALIAHLAKAPDLQLVVRIHPREGANKRDSVVSQHLVMLREQCSQLPENCRIVWPEDTTSSYDLAEVADLALIGWSTIGLEMARLGVPVLAMNRGTTYPGDDFIEYADSAEEYFRKFDQLLQRPATLETVIRAFRYYHAFHLGYALDLSDLVTSSAVTCGFQGLPPYRLPREAGTIEDVLTGREDIFELNLKRLQERQGSAARTRERDQVAAALRRLFHFLMTGEEPAGEIELACATGGQTQSGPEAATVSIDGMAVGYTTPDGRLWKKHSTMCARLALIVLTGSSVATTAAPAAPCQNPGVRVTSVFDSAVATAREHAAAGSSNEAIQWYLAAIGLKPGLQIALLAELFDRVYLPLGERDRYTLYVSRFFDFRIQPGDKVLDIGSGHLPFPFATHLADFAVHDGNYGRAGIPFKHLDGKPVYECSVESMPFGDGEFDFINCSHVLEHVADPEQACAELMRVGKRGYIEIPTKGKDQWLNTAHPSNHRWWVEKWDDTLVFTQYTAQELRGLDCNLLLDMHCNPQSDRERAFSALLYLKADQVNVMHYWEGEIRCLVRRLPSPQTVATGDPDTAPAAAPPLPAAPGPRQQEEPEKAVTPSCLFINTYYEGFLQAFYGASDHAGRPYREQKELLQAECFGDSDFYSEGLRRQGWRADDLIVNAGPLQTAWARENGCTGTGLAVALEQIRRARPDVVYLQDLSLASPGFIEAIRQHTTLIVAQIASPVPEGAHLAGIDIMVSSFPHFVKRFREAGITSYYQPLAFDPRVLERIPETPRDIEVSFVGGISPNHGKGLEVLEKIAAASAVEFWGYGAHHLAPGSPIASRHHGEAWGSYMFSLLRRSRITLNRHIDAAEDAANNMRLFEATGCGALLITDYKDNLAELFEIGTEVVAYRTAEECASLIAYYLAHPEEASAIARAGQARTLRDHSYAGRMEQTARLLLCHLRDRVEPGRFDAPDLTGISHGHTPIRGSEIAAHQVSAWKDAGIPAKQRAVVRQELQQMYRGQGPVIFTILADTLRPHLPPGAPLLEIGCASGYYSEILEYLLNRPLDYTGVDYSEAMIAMAKDYYPGGKFFASDGACLFFADRSFHTVISSCVLLHVPNYREHIFESARVADRLVVASRTPVCRTRPTQYLKKFAYGVETVELILNEAELLHEFALNGFDLLNGVQYYTNDTADQYQVTYLFQRR